ncbi:MAG: helix-turn-helix domain-containing protein, partial [Gammaproteobacteria bacterium]
IREVMERIRAYSWPGNVRELENTLERSVLFCKGSELTHLELDERQNVQASCGDWTRFKQQILAEAELSYLSQALQTHRGDVKQVAAEMGITPRAVYGKLKKNRIDIGKFRKEG